MARISAIELKNIHPDSDIWVIASGSSTGFIEPDFFDNKISIGVNRVWMRYPTTYIVVKEGVVLQDAINKGNGAKVIASKYNCGQVGSRLNKAHGDFYYFEHRNNGLERVDLEAVGGDEIVVSFSTITSAMHMAAYMGAKNILLVGHDCGFIDGMINFEGYPDNLMKSEQFYRDFLSRIEPQSILVRDKLQEVYNCNIYSLNPFLNLGMEDHSYESASS
jgi:hypothetical protein